MMRAALITSVLLAASPAAAQNAETELVNVGGYVALGLGGALTATGFFAEGAHNERFAYAFPAYVVSEGIAVAAFALGGRIAHFAVLTGMNTIGVFLAALGLLELQASPIRVAFGPGTVSVSGVF
jgi:hypothetical protein